MRARDQALRRLISRSATGRRVSPISNSSGTLLPKFRLKMSGPKKKQQEKKKRQQVRNRNRNPLLSRKKPGRRRKFWKSREDSISTCHPRLVELYSLKWNTAVCWTAAPLQVLFSRGEMVEVLISSGISRYAEFKNVPNIYSFDKDEKKLVRVPCSRADVFSSKEVSMIEKRLLMRTMTACVDFEKNPETLQGTWSKSSYQLYHIICKWIHFPAFEDKSFGEFLTANQIQGKIRQFILETVAMAEETTPCPTAIEKVRKFVTSIGRFGNTPFLWTLYGTGELPQCFCR